MTGREGQTATGLEARRTRFHRRKTKLSKIESGLVFGERKRLPTVALSSSARPDLLRTVRDRTNGICNRNRERTTPEKPLRRHFALALSEWTGGSRTAQCCLTAGPSADPLSANKPPPSLQGGKGTVSDQERQTPGDQGRRRRWAGPLWIPGPERPSSCWYRLTVSNLTYKTGHVNTTSSDLRDFRRVS